MKIMVTGGDGFIGGEYVKYMRNIGHDVSSYDLPNNDILDDLGLEICIQKSDMVVHFAAMADITVCIKEQDKVFDVNIRGTYNIAKYCAKYKKKLIFISTCCVYGNSLDDIEVEFSTAPMSCEPYAVSKVAGEAIIRGMPDLDFVILRIGTIYGPGMREALFT